MPKRTFTPEQIVAKLRQLEVLASQGKTVGQPSGRQDRDLTGRRRSECQNGERGKKPHP